MGTALGEKGVDLKSVLWSVGGLVEEEGRKDTAEVRQSNTPTRCTCAVQAVHKASAHPAMMVQCDC